MFRMFCSCAIVAAAFGIADPASAQHIRDETGIRGPRFLLTAADPVRHVRTDANRVPLLRRRITVYLDNVPLKQALDEISAASGVRLIFSGGVVPLDSRVSLKSQDITLAGALMEVLFDAGVDVLISGISQVALVKKAPEPEPAPPTRLSTIVGQVTDARSGAGVGGASVTLDGTPFGAATGSSGRYRITDVPAGTHTVVVQQIGYTEARRSVTVADEETVTVDFELDVSALPLDQIVATGTAFATEVRTMPNPINVITAEKIEAKGSSNITDLLRGEIPGVMALSNGQDDTYSYIYVRGNGGGSVQDLIKTYIDGVEVAHPQYLSTLDPKSIERIEVVRGPQASVIYGSDAASGVLQIFTKRGTAGLARPRLNVLASAGAVESDYTPSGAGAPLKQDYALDVSGGAESFTYRAGVSYGTIGEWVKHYGSRTLGASSGLRVVQGPITAELTALWSDRDYDLGDSPIYLRYPAGACPQCGNPDYQNSTNYALSQNTMGLTLGYRATTNWQHTLTLGDDQNRYALHQPQPSYNTPADTFVRLFNQEFRRRSVRYHTAYDAKLGERTTARFTAGLDYWSYDVQGSLGTNLLSAFGTVRTSPSTSSIFYNDGWWNAGYFGMVELGWRQELYLTLAGRVEDNPNLGEEYGRALAPRVGASWVRALGAAEMKLRAQWGKGVRPPPPEARAGRIAAPTLVYLENPAIAPEEKVGWDAGMDLYWGSWASLSLTRFQEEAKNLIYLEDVDITGTPVLRQFRNVGVVAVEGWEAEGRMELGRVAVEVNYAYSDNVVNKVDAATAADPEATLQVGDRTNFAPKHSGGGRLAMRVARGSVSVDGSVMSGRRFLDYVAYFGYLYGGEAYRGSTRAYYTEYPALWKWNLHAEQALGDQWSAFVRIENLGNNQEADLHNFNVTPGRTTVVGVRFTR